MDTLSAISLSLLSQLPLFAVWIIGLIFTIVLWRKHPKVSLLVFISVLGLLALSIADTYLNIWLPTLVTEHGYSLAKVGSLYTIKSHGSSFTAAIFWALLGIAVFGWRNKMGNGVIEEAGAGNVSKINRVGLVSLILSVFLSLIILGTFLILILAGMSTTGSNGLYGFWSNLFGILGKSLFFSLWALPLGITNIILALIAHRTDYTAQKKVARLGITMGTIGIIIRSEERRVGKECRSR